MSSSDEQERQDLIVSAQSCENQLGHFQQHVEDQKSSAKKPRREGTQMLLEKASNYTRSTINFLQLWRQTFPKPAHTSDAADLNTIRTVFDELTSAIQYTKRITDRRLALGLRRWIPGQKYTVELKFTIARLILHRARVENKIKDALLDISQIICRLPKYTDSQDPDGLRDRISGVREQRTLYNIFRDEISNLSKEERGRVRFGALDFLWQHIPQKKELANHIGDVDNPGDGIIYDIEDVKKVDKILKFFCDAWRDSPFGSESSATATAALPTDKVDTLMDMSKICLVLRNMNQTRIFDFFRDCSMKDTDLPLRKDTLHEILPKEEAFHARTFYTEQFRAVSRSWVEGERLEIDEREPLPLVTRHELGRGSFAKVTKCTHAFEGGDYAHKQHILSADKGHLETEIERIKKLRHRHVIQYVKSWRRGNKCGLLLKPAATTDLKRYLKRYEDNAYNPQRDENERIPARTRLEPFLLNAFGCLSLGLLYIHGQKVRHKDIKPSNILFDQPQDQDQDQDQAPRFIWADFGIAYDFGDREDSRTVSGSIGSPKYAAPEVAESAANAKSSSTQQFLTVNPQSAQHQQQHQSNSQPVGPGKPSDIFSFGCVFLEILSYLVAGPDEKLDRSDFKEFDVFHLNIKNLQIWAQKMSESLPAAKMSLGALFRLAIRMISEKEDDRPKISEIVLDLKGGGAVYFCPHCQREVNTIRDVSSTKTIPV